MKIKNVLSLFDGMSCGQIALNKLKVTYVNYFASEIDKFAIKVTQANYPETVQLGDVVALRKVLEMDIELLQYYYQNKIYLGSKSYMEYCIQLKTEGCDLLLAGSPCQGFSFAGKMLNFEDPRSKLFFEFIKIKDILQPKYWLLENVRMKKPIETKINILLGCKPYRFNSSLVSAQNRYRLYWSNIKVFSKPKDQRIFLKDILQPLEEVDMKYFIKNKKIDISKITSEFDKNRALRVGGRGSLTDKHHFDVVKLSKKLEPKKNQDKASCFTAGGNSGGNHSDMDVLCQLLPQSLREVRTDEAKKIRRETKAATGKDFTPFRGKEMEIRLDGKHNCLTAGNSNKSNMVMLHQKARGQNKGGFKKNKSTTLTSNSWERNNTLVEETDNEKQKIILRRLTPIECERLQTVPDNYTSHVSDTQRYKMLGNGWTVDIVKFIFQYAFSNNQK